MKLHGKHLAGIVVATAWIGASEFLRNQIVFNSYWTDHYRKLGLTFPSAPIHGAVWGVWSLALAVILYVLTQKFSFWQTVFLGWVNGFVLMWLVIGNLGVLPFSLLWFAVPWSLLEVTGAVWLLSRFKPAPKTT